VLTQGGRGKIRCDGTGLRWTAIAHQVRGEVTSNQLESPLIDHGSSLVNLEEFLRNFDIYRIVCQKMETVEKSAVAVHLLDIGRKVACGTRFWTRQDLDCVARWKGLRPAMLAIKRSELEIEALLAGALRVDDEETRIKRLCKIRGIGFVFASAVLMFTWPETYGFIDYSTCNALNYLGFEFPKKYCGSKFTVSQLSTYFRLVRRLARDRGTSAMEMAKALQALENKRTKTTWQRQFEALGGIADDRVAK
jgi:hypothetical protein